MISPLLHTQHNTHTPSAWMMPSDLGPVPNPVPGLGHFSQAVPGHSCAAPKHQELGPGIRGSLPISATPPKMKSVIPLIGLPCCRATNVWLAAARAAG
ncbi:MAG TPA: hypothetical protein VMT51_10835, partial [Dongiaceae bacterium]|nr:hypothetical protein [Dongiaceae bacterium]